MSGFSAAAVSTLDYDFSEIPRDDGNGFVGGNGVVAEPSTDRVNAFYAAIVGIKRLTQPGYEPTGEEKTNLHEILADICDGSPTLEEIKLLPPRYLGAFTSWLFKELTDPKG